MLTLGELRLLFLAERRVQKTPLGLGQVCGCACPQAGPAVVPALSRCPALSRETNKRWGGCCGRGETWLDGGDIPALRGCPESSGALSWLYRLVQTFPGPSLGPSPEARAGSAKQEQPHLLQSWLPSLWHIYTTSAAELLGAWLMCAGPSALWCGPGEGLEPRADARSPPFPRKAGSISHPSPRRGLLGWLQPSSLRASLFLRPSRFPGRGHCSQHYLMGAAAPFPPALPRCGLRPPVLTKHTEAGGEHRPGDSQPALC